MVRESMRNMKITEHPILVVFLTLAVLGLEVLLGVISAVAPWQVPIALIVGIPFLLVTLTRPQVTFLLMIFLIPIRGQSFDVAQIGGMSVRLFDLAALPTCAAWILSSMFGPERRLPIEKAATNIPLLVFGALVTMSFAWSASGMSTISKTLQFVYALILVHMCLNLVRSEDRFRRVVTAWLLAAILMSFVRLSTGFASAATGSYERSSSVDSTKLEMCDYFNYSIFLVIALFFSTKSVVQRGVLFGLGALFFLAELSTLSRGPFLGLAAGGFFLLVHAERVRRFLPWVFGILIGGCIAAYVIGLAVGFDPINYIVVKLFDRFTDPVSVDGINDYGVNWRLPIWKASIELFMSYPFIGVGAGSFSDTAALYVSGTTRSYGSPNNIYLLILCEYGAIGFGVFVWFIASIVKRFRQVLTLSLTPHYRIMCLALASALLSKSVSNLTYGWFIEDRTFWVLLGLSFAFLTIAESHTEPAPGEDALRPVPPSESVSEGRPVSF